MKQVYISLAIVVLAVGGYIYFTNKQNQKPIVVDESVSQTTPVETTSASVKTPMKATIQTNQGTIVLEFNSNAPKTVENFAKLAESGFYDGTRFHRVIKGFMIQGGDPLSKDVSKQALWGTGGPGYQFEDEIHSQNNNTTGTIAMANSGPDTNGSQFFINAADNNFLDPKHTVFGKVISGMDVVRKIEALPTGPADRPTTDALIQKVTISRPE